MTRRRRHLWGAAAVGTTLALTAALLPSYVSWAEQFHDPAVTTDGLDDADAQAAALLQGGASADGHDHVHNDPATKNAISRAPAGEGTADPTSAARAATGRAAVEAQRAEKDPTLLPGRAPAGRATVPGDRYAMAGGCYALQAPDGRWVTRAGGGWAATAAERSAAEPFHFQATDLGSYLLFAKDQTFVAVGLLGAVGRTPTASAKTVWTVERTARGFTFARDGATLGVDGRGTLTRTGATPFALRLTTGCAPWPEITTNVRGEPHRGASPFQEVRGYLDAHTHGMAFEFLGGQVHCGRPWSPYGVQVALTDCVDHQLANGAGALLENLLRTGAPVGTHDPVGWPTFRDWPAPDSLTHEGTYYRWVERAWRGGQRVLVNLLVENNQLCTVYPLKRNSCDDMDSIRLQAQQMRNLERYVDAQNGGPGKGWYRIVTDPFQARKVINEGKLAVVMGIETSVLFGCSTKLDQPQCTTAEIDRQLDEVHALGVRQMELVNKFDNALAGVAGDTGGIAPLINGANFLETGSFWDMRKCAAGQEGVEDRSQLTAPTIVPEQDALFGAIAQLYIPVKLPLYASGPHCNARGLTSLGDHTIMRMAQKKMLFDPDHMSVAARKSSLDLVERIGYDGVLSSHSWSTPDAYPRIYRAGGLVTPYAGDSDGFVQKWRQHLAWADPRYYFGFGFGADINGLGAQGDPRGADVPDKVTYPFRGLGGVTIDRQVSGERVYDINTDGVAHYGLYPDWIEDLRKQGGQAIVDDMARGAEAYLQTWERAEGVRNDGCRDRASRPRDAILTGLRPGASVEKVLRTVGQPHSRLGTTFTYCTATSKGATRKRTVTFTAAGAVRSVA
jgi:hypothetical protein